MASSSSRSLVEQHFLLHLCHELANAASLEAMFGAVVEALVEANGFSRAAALTFDGGGVMCFRVWRGFSDAYRAAVEGHSPWGVDQRQARPIFVDDVERAADLASLLPAFRREAIGALAFLPIAGGGRLLGKFMLYADRPVVWHEQELGFALAAADLLASFLLREEVQDRLLQARKIESLGLLAGGIAHDFNNLLTAILGYVDLIRGETVRGTPARNYVEELLRTVEAASDLPKQLLGFARPDASVPEPVDLCEFLGEVQPSLERLCGGRHALVVQLPQEPAVVFANRAQVQQLLVNLVTNARDAMAAGGTVTITLVSPRDAAHVEIAVADTGVGMDEATRRRVFEPLFTTKAEGGGAGLWLAMCYAIVAAGGGDIAVRSAAGCGSTFVVRLPRAKAGQGATLGTPSTPPVARVLLVEDQEMVRSMLVRALVGMGFQVLTANDGEQALELLARRTVDCVVSDVVMPRLSGIELAKVMAQRWPQVHVLLVTGFVDAPHAVPEGVPILSKPFLPRELGRRVRELLRVRS